MKRRSRVSLLAAALLQAASMALAVPVEVPSLDRAAAGAPVQMPGHWFAASQPGPRPALVLLHGCGGYFDNRGRLAERYTSLAARLNELGIHVLVTDSLTPRGERELCTQRNGERKVTMVQRRRDALGALAWLAARSDVDGQRVGLLGWSNGGSTVLAATQGGHPEVAKAAVKPSLAVAFYPGCEVESQRGYRPVAPLLLLVGEADDWTPAAPCRVLAQQAPQAIRIEVYPGAYHGFDGTAPLRLRRDVPNGVNPGAGVHVGSQPEARAASARALEAFLRERWGLS